MVEIDTGVLTVLEGPSGGGKSTLLRQIAGLAEAPDVVRELDGRAWPEREMSGWRAVVTLLMQDAPIVPGSIRENLEFPYRLKSARGRVFDETRASDFLQRAGLGSIALDRPAATLSGGERHRLGLVRAVLWDAPVILADEPLSGLDGPRAMECLGLLADFARRPGHAVLCVLHDPALGRNADQRLILSQSGLGAA